MLSIQMLFIAMDLDENVRVSRQAGQRACPLTHGVATKRKSRSEHSKEPGGREIRRCPSGQGQKARQQGVEQVAIQASPNMQKQIPPDLHLKPF